MKAVVQRMPCLTGGGQRAVTTRRGPPALRPARVQRLSVVARQAAPSGSQPVPHGVETCLQPSRLPAGLMYGATLQLAGLGACNITRARGPVLQLMFQHLQGIEGAQAILNTCRAIKPLAPKVNKTTALHVRVGQLGGVWDLQHLKNICINWVYFEPTLDMLVPPSRRGNDNQYCRSMLTALGGDPVTAAARIQDAPNVASLVEVVNPRGGQSERPAGGYKLNLWPLKAGGSKIEFRHPGGTQNGAKAVRYMQMYGSLVLRSQGFVVSGPQGPYTTHSLSHFIHSMLSDDPGLQGWVRRRARELAAAAAAARIPAPAQPASGHSSTRAAVLPSPAQPASGGNSSARTASTAAAAAGVVGQQVAADQGLDGLIPVPSWLLPPGLIPDDGDGDAGAPGEALEYVGRLVIDVVPDWHPNQ